MPVQTLGYLVPQFPGQTHIFFWREIEELEKRGTNVALFSTKPPPSSMAPHGWTDEATARTSYLGALRPAAVLHALRHLPLAALWRLWRSGETGAVKEMVLMLPAAAALKLECKARGISHVHAHSCGRSAMIAALAHQMGGPSYSLTLHGPLQDYGPAQRYKWRKARFATIITQKLYDEMQAELGADLPSHIVIQAMGVDAEAFARPAPYAPTGKALQLFSCGRLNLVKGHQDLLAAVVRLRKAGRDVHLEIAGEDDDGGTGFRAVLEAKIIELGLQDHATLLGAIDAQTVRRKLWAADIFVLASWAEPLGVALMEAMVAGVPTIGTNAGGVAELITDGVDGLLARPADADDLAQTIARLADDPALAARLSAAGAARIRTDFHSARGAEALLKALDETLG